MSARPSLLARVLEAEFSTIGPAGRRYWNDNRARILRRTAAHLGHIRRDPGDAIHSDADAVGFAAARAFVRGPGLPGWLPVYQETACRLAKLAAELEAKDA